MYNTKKVTKFYIYNCWKEQYVYSCNTLDELIKYIAKFNYSPFLSKKNSNRFINSFNCTLKDVEFVFDKNKYVLKEYTVFDENFRIIDIRQYKDEILSYDYLKRHKAKWATPALEYKYEKTKPEFRAGPVPNTGRRHHGSYYRSPKTFAEIRENANPEYKEFVRKKRLYLPTTWDDLPKSYSKSWKDQSKKRKQWMR